jgi:hypothetical protein
LVSANISRIPDREICEVRSAHIKVAPTNSIDELLSE